MLIAFVLIGGGVSIYAWRMPDIYRSEATIGIQPAAVPQDYVRSSDRATPEERIGAIRQQLQSRSFILLMIERNGLFGSGSDDFSEDRAVAAVRNGIQVASTSRNTFRISYSAADPQFARTFTQRIVDELISTSNKSRETRARKANDFLDEQLRQKERELASHEEKIKQFKDKYLGGLPEQSNANLNALSGLQMQYIAVENALQQSRERQKLFDLRAQERNRLSVLTRNIVVPAARTDDVVKSNPTVNRKLEAKEAELAALRSKYTSSHPDVVRLSREVEDLKRQLAAEMSALPETVAGAGDQQAESPANEADAMAAIEDSAIKLEADSIKNEIAKREKEKDAILARIAGYQAKLKLAPAIEQELMSLSREHEILRKQFENLTGKKFQAEMTENLETGTDNDIYTIIDNANLPEMPAFPNRTQIMLMGLGAAFVLGIGAAFGRELFDTTLDSEEEAVAVLKLPVLVSISEVPRKQARQLTGDTAKSA